MAEKTMNGELPKISKDNKKFTFVDETKTVIGSDGKEHILHRIKANRDLVLADGGIVVRKGELGGFIEKEENLDFSENSNAWVFDDAMIYEDAHVTGDAGVGDNAQVYGNGQVSGKAWVFGNAQIYENAVVSNLAGVSENAKVHGETVVEGIANVHGKADLTEGKWTHGDITEKNSVKEARRP